MTPEANTSPVEHGLCTSSEQESVGRESPSPGVETIDAAGRVTTRASKQCKTCPFRGADEAYRRECAIIAAADWPCHTEDLYGTNGIQCRGHWEAVRKYGPASLAQPGAS